MYDVYVYMCQFYTFITIITLMVAVNNTKFINQNDNNIVAYYQIVDVRLDSTYRNI